MESFLQKQLDCLVKNIQPADESSREAAVRHWDSIAKPIHGLGILEDQISQIAAIQRTPQIQIDRRGVVVFCADNGVVEEGVTQTDSSVTAIVADNFAKGMASVNRLAHLAEADVLPIDIGIAGETTEVGVRNCKIAYGTKNLAKEPAMTREQALEAIHTGIQLASEMKDMGYDILAVGEMGIGNTTTSSAIAAVLLGLEAEEVTGRGAGLSDAGLQKKIQVIRDAITLHRPDPSDPVGVLSAVGGFDLAGMCGLMLGGAIYQIPIVLDGMISASAALLAQAICPVVTDYLLASHMGKEPVCHHAMERLGLHPPITAELALGEGTGAVMLFPMLVMAHAVYHENPSFDDIHIEAYEKFE
jgi:nicotinate-nucleotide--dimethylbenzimidazole phosphoribosyltransferase